ncbi:ABC1 kinase family protein [Agrilactobacillus yilanensis]|uniref:ABC1 kinase family protein n=1 Tax=Agrilactobacillus yilanensis TaxID=2485997 RepID=A0ABW4J7Q0_9LACO|nr:AarF/UbiB family protein [Agrilactobacillus yilanensis]
MAKTQTAPKKRGQNTKRVQEIISVIRRYDVLRNLGAQKNPQAVRTAFETLGPTFIKIGQMLSTRPDIVSPAYVHELSKLQDNVKADDFAVIQKIIETEFNQPLTELFDDFEPTPIASASMGQVHRTKLKNGLQVAVKIQHPGITDTVSRDLAILSRLVRAINWLPNNQVTQVVEPKEIFAQFKTALEKELDSRQEAENNAHFYRLNHQVGIFEVPRVYPEYCTAKIVTTEYKAGESLKRYLKKIENKAVDAKRRYIATALVNNFMKQVFEDGFFHADPHPGNILLNETAADFSEFGNAAKPQALNKTQKLPNYRLVYLDFGMMGTIDKTLVQNLADVVIAVNSKNADQIGQGLLNICKVVGPLDKNKFFEALSEFIGPYYNSGLGAIDLEAMGTQIISLCKQNNLQMNPAVSLLMKAFGALEGIVLQLDPDISMLEVARPFTRRYIVKNVNFRNEFEDRLLDAYQLSKDLPKIGSQLRATLELIARGRLRVGIDLNHRDQVLDRIEAMVNKVVAGLILAALIVGSSMLVQQQDQHTWIARLGIMGYIVAAAIIVIILASSLWQRFSRRHKKK